MPTIRPPRQRHPNEDYAWHYEKGRSEGRPFASSVKGDDYTRRSTIIFLISAIALAGFNPLGQACEQFMMVWQR